VSCNVEVSNSGFEVRFMESLEDMVLMLIRKRGLRWLISLARQSVIGIRGR
jgi:hypothetical protein